MQKCAFLLYNGNILLSINAIIYDGTLVKQNAFQYYKYNFLI